MGEYVKMSEEKKNSGALKGFWRRICNGEITDSLTQNFMVYIVSYILTALLSSVPSIGFFASLNTSPGSAAPFLQSFADCLLPTTVTLTLSSTVQNLASAPKIRALMIWNPILVFLGTVVYLLLRVQSAWWLPYVFCGFVVLNTISNLFVVSQIQAETMGGSISREKDA